MVSNRGSRSAGAVRTNPVVLVVSALAGVTDALTEIADRLEQGRSVEEDLACVVRRHRDMAMDLDLDPAPVESNASVILSEALAAGPLAKDRRARSCPRENP